MADKERLRLRSTVADLLSPAQVNRGARGTVTGHDEPADGGDVKGSQGQEQGSPADLLSLSLLNRILPYYLLDKSTNRG